MIKILAFVLIYLLSSLAICLAKSKAELIDNLYLNYDSRIRPSKVYSKKVSVEFGVHLIELLDVVSLLVIIF